MNKEQLQLELKKLFKSLDFVSDNFLNEKKKSRKKDFDIYFNIYQQLGLLWEYLGLHCKHWDGYKKVRDEKEACKICGKIKSADESYYLFPTKGQKIIGRKSKPNSKKTFKNKIEATIIDDTINFHGAVLNVGVHNSYKSKLLKEHDINMARERIVKLKESEVECSLDDHLISIEFPNTRKNIRGKHIYGNFVWELRRNDLKKFPVMFNFDKNYNFLGLTIFR